MIDLLAEVSFVEVLGQALTESDAKEKIILLNPDTLLLDINIAGSNGFEILVWLRKSNKKMKVIMLSNFSQKEYRDKAFNLGADYFLDKATEFEKLPELLFEIHRS